MRTRFKILLACAAVATAGTAAVASALPGVHHLTIQLPGGGIENITYSGAAAPDIVIFPRIVPGQAVVPGAAWPALDQISAEMNQVSAAMNRAIAIAEEKADAMANSAFAYPDSLMHSQLGPLPAGAQSYSFVSTVSGNNICTKEVEITRQGNAKPKIVSHQSGNCAGMNAPNSSANSANAISPQPQLLRVKTELRTRSHALHA